MIKKIVIKFLLIPALIMGGIAYYGYNKTGKIPFIDKDGLSALFGSGSSGDSTAELRAKITHKGNINTSKSTQTFYKWKDENGRWHYGTEAPENTASKSVDYDPTSNSMAAVKVKPVEKDSGSSNTSHSTKQSKTEAEHMNPLNAIKNAQGLQQKIDDQHKAQQEQFKAMGL